MVFLGKKPRNTKNEHGRTTVLTQIFVELKGLVREKKHFKFSDDFSSWIISKQKLNFFYSARHRNFCLQCYQKLCKKHRTFLFMKNEAPFCTLKKKAFFTTNWSSCSPSLNPMDHFLWFALKKSLPQSEIRGVSHLRK